MGGGGKGRMNDSTSGNGFKAVGHRKAALPEQYRILDTWAHSLLVVEVYKLDARGEQCARGEETREQWHPIVRSRDRVEQ